MLSAWALHRHVAAPFAELPAVGPWAGHGPTHAWGQVLRPRHRAGVGPDTADHMRRVHGRLWPHSSPRGAPGSAPPPGRPRAGVGRPQRLPRPDPPTALEVPPFIGGEEALWEIMLHANLCISDDSLTRSSCAEKHLNFPYKHASLLRWVLGARCQAQPLPGAASRSQRWLWAGTRSTPGRRQEQTLGQHGEEGKGQEGSGGPRARCHGGRQRVRGDPRPRGCPRRPPPPPGADQGESQPQPQRVGLGWRVRTGIPVQGRQLGQRLDAGSWLTCDRAET